MTTAAERLRSAQAEAIVALRELAADRFTHDNTPHARTSALKPAAPSRSRAVRAAATTAGRTGR